MSQEEKGNSKVNDTALVTEDWTAVLVGGAVILNSLLGVRITNPIYEWAGIKGVLNNVTSVQNWLNVLGQFVLVLVFSVTAALLIVWNGF